MGDDLVKRLRTPVGFQDLPFIQEEAADRIEQLEERLENEMQDLDAADCRAKRLQNRIEELEAKLAKAVEAAEKAVGHIERIPPRIATARVELCDAIAELKGQDDE